MGFMVLVVGNCVILVAKFRDGEKEMYAVRSRSL